MKTCKKEEGWREKEKERESGAGWREKANGGVSGHWSSRIKGKALKGYGQRSVCRVENSVYLIFHSENTTLVFRVFPKKSYSIIVLTAAFERIGSKGCVCVFGCGSVFMFCLFCCFFPFFFFFFFFFFFGGGGEGCRLEKKNGSSLVSM